MLPYFSVEEYSREQTLAGAPSRSLSYILDCKVYRFAIGLTIAATFIRVNKMSRHVTRKLVGLCLGTLALLVASPALAQRVVVYDLPTPVTTYYAPAAVTTYYAPAVVAPTVTYYAPAVAPIVAAPTVTRYAPSVAPTVTYDAPSADPTTTYYAPAPTTTYYAPTPVTTYYAPTTTAYVPTPVTTYYAPAAPVTVYRPGVVVRPKVYVSGQPVRNFFRAITP